jgi:hypothetical protein
MALTQVPDLRSDWEAFLAGYPTLDDRDRRIDPQQRERSAAESWASRLPRDWQQVARYGGLAGLEQHLRDQRAREERGAEEGRREAAKTAARFRERRFALRTEIEELKREVDAMPREPKFHNVHDSWGTAAVISERRAARERLLDAQERYDQLAADEHRLMAQAKSR